MHLYMFPPISVVFGALYDVLMFADSTAGSFEASKDGSSATKHMASLSGEPGNGAAGGSASRHGGL